MKSMMMEECLHISHDLGKLVTVTMKGSNLANEVNGVGRDELKVG